MDNNRYRQGNNNGTSKPYNGGGNSGGGRSYGGGGGSRRPERSEPKERRKCFTIVLDSETPDYVIGDLLNTSVLQDLSDMGYYLRIGLPEKGGLDTEEIRKKISNHHFMVPWKGFNDVKDAYCYTTEDAKGIYKASSMSELSDAVLAIASIKVNLLLGESCENPSDFLLIWTIDGAENVREMSKKTGYLSVLIKLATKQNIKVLNLNNANAWEEVLDVAKRSTR